MVKGIKSEKRKYETEWYLHNNWDDKRISQKDPELEKRKTRWSSGLLAEKINNISAEPRVYLGIPFTRVTIDLD